MTHAVVALDVGTSLADALWIINDRRVACLPVLDADHRVVCVLDERQILRALVTHAADTVGELASGRTVVLPVTATAAESAAAILENDVPGAAVVAAGELVGVITRGDAMRGLLRERDALLAAAERLGPWQVNVHGHAVTIAPAQSGSSGTAIPCS